MEFLPDGDFTTSQHDRVYANFQKRPFICSGDRCNRKKLQLHWFVKNPHLVSTDFKFLPKKFSRCWKKCQNGSFLLKRAPPCCSSCWAT